MRKIGKVLGTVALFGSMLAMAGVTGRYSAGDIESIEFIKGFLQYLAMFIVSVEVAAWGMNYEY